jgi:hypothetical protein
VAEPRDVEEVALVAVRVVRALPAVLVVPDQVEQVVEHLERPREVGGRVGELAGRRAKLADERARLADERADPVAHDRRRLLGERRQRLVGLVELGDGRREPLERRPQDPRELLDAPERLRRLPQRLGQLVDRRADVRVL